MLTNQIMLPYHKLFEHRNYLQKRIKISIILINLCLRGNDFRKTQEIHVKKIKNVC